MQASIGRAYFIILSSILFTLVVMTLIVLIKATIFRLSRQNVNNFTSFWSKKILNFVKVRYKIFDPHRLEIAKDKNYIIVSNHTTLYDIPLIILAFPCLNVRMLAKLELFSIPIFGYVLKLSEHLKIDRENKMHTVRDLRFVKKKMDSGIIPWISPEGGRSKDGKLQPFKKGAFWLAKKNNAVIIPVVIKGANKILPAKSLKFNLNQEVELTKMRPIDLTNHSWQEVLKIKDELQEQFTKILEC